MNRINHIKDDLLGLSAGFGDAVNYTNAEERGRFLLSEPAGRRIN